MCQAHIKSTISTWTEFYCGSHRSTILLRRRESGGLDARLHVDLWKCGPLIMQRGHLKGAVYICSLGVNETVSRSRLQTLFGAEMTKGRLSVVNTFRLEIARSSPSSKPMEILSVKWCTSLLLWAESSGSLVHEHKSQTIEMLPVNYVILRLVKLNLFSIADGMLDIECE